MIINKLCGVEMVCICVYTPDDDPFKDTHCVLGLDDNGKVGASLVFLLSVQPHNAARVQQRGPVSPPGPNPCGETPVEAPPCKSPPASPARAHATAPAVKATMHK
uniref:Uncharacterized protein n=1 Tax=Vitis vinifera TaxID=29760 RepID=A5BVX6_VITVI|nr:hypothetical protein VITISV_044217 [Vitis vinifera]